MSGVRPAVAAKDVTARRGDRTVWTDGSFVIPEGSFTAVIGPNGSGKTTLLLMLLGLLPAAEGQLTVLGETPRRGDPRIGYVPQNYAATTGAALRARDLVELGLTGGRWGLPRSSAADRRRVDEVLAAVGATDVADTRLSELSGGQQQRVAIATALVNHPAMLVLDEPLANLDSRNAQEIVALLDRLRRERGVTVIVVVHDLNPLLGVLDGAVYLLDGHAHHADVHAVVDEHLLTHLYGTRVRVVRTPSGDLFTRAG